MIKDLLIKEKDNDKVAIKENEKQLSYRVWYEHSKIISETLRKVIKSHTVGVLLPNSIDYAIAYFGVCFADKIVVPIDCRTKMLELKDVIEFCEIDFLICNKKTIEAMKKEKELFKYNVLMFDIETKQIYSLNSCKMFISDVENTLQDNLVDTDVAVILNTSGTTQNSKKVMLTNINIETNIINNLCNINVDYMKNILIMLPMCFGYCHTSQFLTSVYLGSTIVVYNDIIIPSKLFDVIYKEKIDSITLVPTLLNLVFNNIQASSINKIRTLKYVFFGGSYISKEFFVLLIEKFPKVSFVQTYGMTECSPRITTLLPENAVEKIDSVGKAIKDVKVKIVNNTGSILGANEIGEIVVESPSVMKGYLKNKVETEQVLIEGTLHTGDIGYIDNDGFLYLIGRKKNIIIHKGINISPEEIEKCLLEHPSIKDAYVYGEKDFIFGEIPVAAIVIKDGYKTNSAEILAFCKTRLSEYKVPKKIYIKTELEKTYNNKTKRGITYG